MIEENNLKLQRIDGNFAINSELSDAVIKDIEEHEHKLF